MAKTAVIEWLNRLILGLNESVQVTASKLQKLKEKQFWSSALYIYLKSRKSPNFVREVA